MNTIQRTLSAMHSVHGGLSTNRKPTSEHDKLVRNTQKWVAQTFYGTMLKQMRKSPFHNDEFDGGRDGQAYEEMFDQRLADHMSQSAGSQLVNSIVDRIESQHRKGGAPTPRQHLDASTAYARAMRHEKPRKPAQPEQPAAPRAKKPATLNGHRHQDKILPEVTYVPPTH